MHYLYVIYSPSVDKYYVGESSDPEKRLVAHNGHFFKKGFTRIARDWRIVLMRECNNRTDAVHLEKFIKRMKSRKFIEKIIERPAVLDDLRTKK